MVIAADVARPSADAILLVWLIGSVVLASLWWLALWRLSRLRSEVPAGCPWPGLLDECRAVLGMGGQVRLVSGRRIAMPCAWGILRPTVTLPAGADGWARSRQRMVLMHELAHLDRRDPLHDFIGRLCVILFWINPLAWLAFKQQRLAAERATDDAVVSAGCPEKPYATLLLEFAKEGLAGRRPLLSPAIPMAQRSTVGLRVERILDASQSRKIPRRRWVLATFASLGLAAGLVGALQDAGAQEPVEDPEPGTVADPELNPNGIEKIRAQLREIIIPEIDFNEATLVEAVEFLRRASTQHEKSETAQKGVNIVIRSGGAAGEKGIEKEQTITMRLTNVPLEIALKYATELAGCRFVVDQHSVVIVPAWAASKQLITRSFRVGRPSLIWPGNQAVRKIL